MTTVGTDRGLRSGIAQRRVAEALGWFGLHEDPGLREMLHEPEGGDAASGMVANLQAAASQLGASLPQTKGVTLITGPSGSGKSTLLRSLAASHQAVVDATALEIAPHIPIAALVDDPLELWLRTLARAGLGEARLLGRTAAQLSEGEQHRVRLALAMRLGMQQPGALVMLDEFVSVLDRATAEGVAQGLARWAEQVAAKSGVRVVVASAHEDLLQLLQPAAVVRCEPLAAPEITSHVVRKHDSGLRIERCDLAAYAPLARFHYLGGPPATVAGVWRAIRTTAAGDRVAGVLIASYPTLNGRWRQAAWGDRYVGLTPARKRVAAQRLNREVRCLSRVVVEPASRGLGVARRLVEHYLHEPLTRRTEAVAAMGAVSPFFARAGMVPHELQPRRLDERLRAALHRAGLEPLDVLTQPGCVARDEHLGKALGVWVRGTAAARRARQQGVADAELWKLAAGRLLARPMAYTAERREL